MNTRYSVGVDIGSQHDYTAICVSEIRFVGPKNELSLIARHLERFRDRLYPDVASSVKALMLTSKLHNRADLIVDATGVGPAVTNIFTKQGISHRPVIIHGGERESYEKGTYRVPKLDLVQTLLVLFHKGNFHVAQGLPHRDTLAQELKEFKRIQNPNTGHLRFEHREGEHDDLLLAAALSAWGARRFGGGTVPGLYSDSGNLFGSLGEDPFSITEEEAEEGLFSF